MSRASNLLSSTAASQKHSKYIMSSALSLMSELYLFINDKHKLKY